MSSKIKRLNLSLPPDLSPFHLMTLFYRQALKEGISREEIMEVINECKVFPMSTRSILKKYSESFGS